MPKLCHCGNRVFSKGLCKTHWLREYGKPIRKESKKRAKQNRTYYEEAKKFKEENPLCAARLEGCTGRTQDVHHKNGRQNESLLESRDWLPVCRNCHKQITDNSRMAIEKGLSKPRIK